MTNPFRLPHGTFYFTEDSSPKARAILVTYYALFIVAGIIVLSVSSKAIRTGVPDWMQYIWGGFYILGGMICSTGVAKKSLPWGIIGLPLLSSASGIFGVCLYLQFQRAFDGAFLVTGTLLIAQALNLLDRWIGTWRLFGAIQGARH
jgi:hypothetical protein